jgi:crotonobetainyl-CoA:carnitine CoA-transferase CaiB-like acyl-CoA transferase
MKISIGTKAEGPLAGVRVLDLSTVVSGPLCAQLLGDMGAEVLKVETPFGDTTRRMGPPFKAGFTGFFAQFNRNKRGLAVDLKTEGGRDFVRRLAGDVDVLIQNWRPGVAERLGVGYADLSAANPRLVYVAISGFGSDGPYRDLPAYDTVIQGLSGFMGTQGRGGGEPTLVRSLAADKTTSLTSLYAVLAALFARERSGEGQLVEIPMLDSYVAFMMPDDFARETFVPQDDLPPPVEIHRTWETKDGHMVLMIIEDHQFQGMCKALEREDLIDDPRCANLIQRVIHAEEIFGEIAADIRKWSTEELIERARRFGAPVAPANDMQTMLADPQVRHSQLVVEAEHPEAGTMRYLRSPARFSRTPTSMRRHPPTLGEHNEEVLREAGYGDDEIAELKKSGAIS